jgi:hypothetical protein
VSRPEQSQLAALFGNRTAIPRGTADVVMERLFPEKRSEVPIDDERKNSVYVILLEVGAFDLKEIEADGQDHESESGIGKGTQTPESETSEVANVLSAG